MFLYKFKRLGKVPFLFSLTFFFFFSFYIPSLDEVSKSVSFEHPSNNEAITVTGRISTPVEQTSKKLEFHFQPENSNQTFLALYFPDTNKQDTEYALEQLKIGSTCRIIGNISLPEESRNPGQFDYQSYLKTKGVSYQVIISSLENVHCEGTSFLHRIYKLRQMIQDYIFISYSDETAAWMTALVLGDDSFIKEETIELFRNWGLSHLLAISGLHVGLIVGLLYFILFKIGLMTKEKAQWIMLLFLPIYALLAGGEPSVWRASMMVFLFIVLSKWKLSISVTDVISIVFLLLILFDPMIIYHVGFQFSFIVTFSLILSGKWLMQTSSLFFQMLKISFVSQMVIIPLQFIYFSMVQPLSIILNVIIVPYFSLFVIPGMFLMMLLSPLPFLPFLFDKLFHLTQSIFIQFIERIDNVVNYTWMMGTFPIVLAILFYVSFVLFMMSVMRNTLKIAFKYGVLLTIIITIVVLRPYFSPYGSVTMLDVGQGDAFIIEYPYRKGVVMIDAGATFSFYEQEVSDKVFKQILKPYLESRGIRKIDAIFLSHEDLDHMGSVDFLVSEFDVSEIIISQYYELPEEIERQWKADGANLKRVKQNEKINIKDNTYHVLSPGKDNGTDNENSMVLTTNIGGKSWLFTGDIGVETEKEIIKTYPDLLIDVLKAGHHGSKTSSDEAFIQHIKPMYALISVGEHNSYGHPSPEVIETLEEAGVNILRTDQHGAIIYRFREEMGTFFKYLP